MLVLCDTVEARFKDQCHRSKLTVTGGILFLLWQWMHITRLHIYILKSQRTAATCTQHTILSALFVGAEVVVAILSEGLLVVVIKNVLNYKCFYHGMF